MRGSRTPEDVRAKFAAHYLYSGNASESAKHVDIPETTGRDLARELQQTEEFVEARRKLRVQALDNLVAMRMRIAAKALSRFEGDGDIDQFAKGDKVTVIDKRADYGKLVLEAEKNAHNLARFDAEKGGEVKNDREVTVRFEPIAPKE